MKKILLPLLFSAVPLTLMAGDKDDFGTWIELGVHKGLPSNFDVGVDADLRTEKNSKRVDRWDIGASLGYRLNKYVKFGVGYQFLDGYSTDKTSKEEYTTSGELISYRYTPSYWTPRHRINVEASGTVKLWKCVRLSLRERYQYTYQPEKTITGRYDTEAPDWDHDPCKDKTNKSESGSMLRSRFKIAYDKKRCDWSPFLSVELHNDLNEDMYLDKVRTSLGTSYKINKHNDISLSYVLTVSRKSSANERMHAISLGYSYDF